MPNKEDRTTRLLEPAETPRAFISWTTAPTRFAVGALNYHGQILDGKRKKSCRSCCVVQWRSLAGLLRRRQEICDRVSDGADDIQSSTRGVSNLTSPVLNEPKHSGQSACNRSSTCTSYGEQGGTGGAPLPASPPRPFNPPKTPPDYCPEWQRWLLGCGPRSSRPNEACNRAWGSGKIAE